MRDEMQYRVYVEPLVKTVIVQVAKDAEKAGITPNEFLRAVWEWSSEMLALLPEEEWMTKRVESVVSKMIEDNTIDGESAG